VRAIFDSTGRYLFGQGPRFSLARYDLQTNTVEHFALPFDLDDGSVIQLGGRAGELLISTNAQSKTWLVRVE